MGSNLPIYHTVSLSIRGKIIRPAIVSEDIIIDLVISSLGGFYWYACCGFNHPSDFTSK